MPILLVVLAILIAAPTPAAGQVPILTASTLSPTSIDPNGCPANLRFSFVPSYGPNTSCSHSTSVELVGGDGSRFPFCSGSGGSCSDSPISCTFSPLQPGFENGLYGFLITLRSSGGVSIYKHPLVPSFDPNAGDLNLCDIGDCAYFQGPSRCTPDSDSDGLFDVFDNCPMMANADQEDRDFDDQGDVCDPFPDQPIDDSSLGHRVRQLELDLDAHLSQPHPDVNNDSRVDILDVTILRRLLVGVPIDGSPP